MPTTNPWRRVFRLLDRTATIVTVLAVAFLVWRTPRPGGPDLIPTHWPADVAFVGIGLTVGAVLWNRGRGPGAMARGASYLLVLILSGMALTRLSLQQYERGAKRPLAAAPPAASDGPGGRSLDAVEWMLRVALHAGIDTNGVGRVRPIPAGWPLPPDVTLGLQARPAGGWVLWARGPEETARVTCHASVGIREDEVTAADLTPACDTATPPPADVVMASPIRGDTGVSTIAPSTATTSWLQYRGDARRTAVIPGTPLRPLGWVAETHTPIRASASAAEGLVMVGGHGTGRLVALERATGTERWAVWLPNWIHQDPVSDGRIVVVGFGDNLRSFNGQAPSGVAALDLSTGRRLWTVFESQSVMTSPTIVDDAVVYASSDGMVRKRILDSGRLVGSVALPGEVVMGPPVRTGDTLIATLDGDQVCAVGIAAMRTLWCRELRDLRMLGHSSAAIDSDLVVVSGVATAVAPGFSNFLGLPWRLQAQMLRTLLFPAYRDYHVADFAGQLFVGLDLATGALRWRSPFYERVRRVDGHTSGTAAIQDGIGAIVLPLADTVVAFAVHSGVVRWTSHANQARGAPLILDDQVIVAGRNGVIELRDLHDGALRCTIRRKVGYDRAGPIVTGGLVVFANLDGEIEAIPASSLLGCTAPGAEPATPAR